MAENDEIIVRRTHAWFTPAYDTIKTFYGDKTTDRSGVKLINHIDEGLRILLALNASTVAKDAYCLHPYFQSDEDYSKHKSYYLSDIDTETIITAIEYRNVANSYLSHMFEPDMFKIHDENVKMMLIADKIQNYKDFMLYHYGTHPRSEELYRYFQSWFAILEIGSKYPSIGFWLDELT